MKVSRVPYSKGPNEVVIRLSEPEAQAALIQLNVIVRMAAVGGGAFDVSNLGKIISELERLYP